VARDALQAALRERERLARDLHDGAIQSLYAVQLRLTRAAEEITATAPQLAQRLDGGRADLNAVIAELRQFLNSLQADEPTPPTAGLHAVLESVVRRLRPASPAAIELVCEPGTAERLRPEQAFNLAGIAREALSNSLRHARAQRIAVRLAVEDGQIVLEVRDDGAGFDPANRAGGGLGLKSLEQRAANLRGRLEFESAPGGGTTVRVRAPLEPAPARS
jgi:signal transduction histidine kinase